jgi:type IV pilus assembly protein PilB
MTRLVEMGIEPFLVGSSLDAVLAQRLARRLCDWCKQPYKPTEQELHASRWPFEDLSMPSELYKPVGCRSCANTGFRGRLAINEVMPVSEEIERLTVNHASATEIQKVALSEGMITLRDDGLAKVARGMSTLEEIVRVTV